MHLAGLEVNLDKLTLNDIFNKLKQMFQKESISDEKKAFLSETIEKYGYLTYSYQKALDELSDAEVIFGVQKKLELASCYKNGQIDYEILSPVERAGFTNSDWFKTEQHNIKLINLAALADGNKTSDVGKFIDWMRQLLILPAGRPQDGVLNTSMYLTPFHPREFGCAYLPAHSGVSPTIECSQLKNELNLTVKDQVKVFLAIAQLAGHPVIYDVLPQTARFSKLVLKAPYIARWFDIPQLISELEVELDEICDNDALKKIIKKELHGKYEKTPDELAELKAEVEEKFLVVKKELSNKMMLKDYQKILQSRAKEIIQSKAGYPIDKELSEDDISNQGEIIGELISKGLWPSPGGAWCSAGVPVFDKMSKGADYPTFKHFNFEGEDVTKFANLDCQTPYYFTFLEDGTLNQPVVDFFIEFLKELQSDYNFDGFRVDHIDHIVNQFSEDKDQNPISYRAPRKVLGNLNSEMRKVKPYFAALAEYMLWDNFLKEYHQDMGFDVLWGQDIVCQHDKNVPQIFADNEQLDEYNKTPDGRLSILKTYNNQDGEFDAIDRYPAQLGKDGAIFKWLKQKTIVGGELSERPCLFVDGDESFTKTGIEKVIGEETSMKRNNDEKFFQRFDAINRFALNSKVLRNGKATLVDNDGNFVSWIVDAENEPEAIFIVANQMPPTQKLIKEDKVVVEKGVNILNQSFTIPEGYNLLAEYIFEELDVQEVELQEQAIQLPLMKPAEFHIYKLRKSV